MGQAESREPVSVGFDGMDPVIGCSYCGAEARVPLEPTAAMLDAVELFVLTHKSCRSTKLAEGPGA